MVSLPQEHILLDLYLLTRYSRLAQWEGQSRKYYYVQRATGHSQWEIPTQPALSVPTPDPTPQQTTDPFQHPPGTSSAVVASDGTAVVRNEDGTVEHYEGADRSLLGVCYAIKVKEYN